MPRNGRDLTAPPLEPPPRPWSRESRSHGSDREPIRPANADGPTRQQFDGQPGPLCGLHPPRVSPTTHGIRAHPQQLSRLAYAVLRHAKKYQGIGSAEQPLDQPPSFGAAGVYRPACLRFSPVVLCAAQVARQTVRIDHRGTDGDHGETERELRIRLSPCGMVEAVLKLRRYSAMTTYTAAHPVKQLGLDATVLRLYAALTNSGDAVEGISFSQDVAPGFIRLSCTPTQQGRHCRPRPLGVPSSNLRKVQ